MLVLIFCAIVVAFFNVNLIYWLFPGHTIAYQAVYAIAGVQAAAGSGFSAAGSERF